MLEVLAVISPIFALIALGYVAGRVGWLPENASSGLAAFSFTLAIPAMLFRSMVVADLPESEPYRIWGAYFGSAFGTWLLAAVLTAIYLRRPAADGVSIGMSAGFANVVMIGIPLCLVAFGPESAATSAIIVAQHSPLLWLMASVHLLLVGSDRDTSIGSAMYQVFRDIAGNTIILAIVAGLLWRQTELGLHPQLDQIVQMLAKAAIPSALVSLGLSLVGFRIAGQLPTLSMIVVLKLIMMPLSAWYLASEVFELPALEVGVITVFAAMPTGANAYLFAAKHGRATNSASGSVALGTLLSITTAAATIYLLNHG